MKINLLYKVIIGLFAFILYAHAQEDGTHDTIYKLYENDLTYMGEVGDQPNDVKNKDNSQWKDYMGIWRNKSCLPISGGINEAIQRIIDGFTTFGISEWIYHDFSMLNKVAEGRDVYADSYDKPFYDEFGNLVSSKMRCKVPTNDIYVCYAGLGMHCDANKNALFGYKLHRFCAPGKCNDLKILSGDPKKDNGEYFEAKSSTKFMGVVKARAIEAGDNICVQIRLTFGWKTMGCKKRIPEKNKGISVSTCYSDPACASKAQMQSKNFISLTGAMIYCLKDSLNKLVNEQTICEGKRNNFIYTFRSNMRHTIMVLLSLYVFFTGIKIAMGKMENKTEILVFFGKITIVSYFALGFETAQGFKSGVDQIYEYTSLISLQLVDIILQTMSSNNNLCNFSEYSYESGFEFLRTWDALDCRLGYYIGFGTLSTLVSSVKGAVFSVGIPGIGMVLTFLLFLPTMLLGIFLIIFFIYLLSAAFYIVQIFAACMFMIILLIIFAPIFVPMILFEQTKQSFDSWWKLIFGFMLQPMIISAYIPLMLIIMDQAIFPDCQFQNKEIMAPVIGIYSEPTFSNNAAYSSSNDIDLEKQGIGNMKFKPVNISYLDANTSSEKCKTSWGYKLAIVKGGEQKKSDYMESFLAPMNIFTNQDNYWERFGISILTITIFSCLFYFFSMMVAGIAADITQTVSLDSMTTGANFIINKAVDLGIKALKVYAPTAGKAMEVANKQIQKQAQRTANNATNKGSGGSGSEGGEDSKTTEGNDIDKSNDKGKSDNNNNNNVSL